MPELQRLRAGHAPAVLAFELANRAYFAASVSDRGDEFYDRFAERHSALLAEQEAGAGAFYVLVAEDGSVLGRFNLTFAGGCTAVLGYRVAQHVAGRGVATAAVRELCGLAAARYGLRTLRAATSRENVASQKVLARAGFIPAGPAGPADLGGKQGTWYQRDLVRPLGSSLLAGSWLRRVAVVRPGEVLLPGMAAEDPPPRATPTRSCAPGTTPATPTTPMTPPPSFTLPTVRSDDQTGQEPVRDFCGTVLARS